VLPEAAAELALQFKRPIMSACWRHGRARIPRAGLSDEIHRRHGGGGRPHVRPRHTKSINAIFSLKSYLPFDVLRPGGDPRPALDEQKRRLADPRCGASL